MVPSMIWPGLRRAGETLAEDGCPHAEVRLRAAFLDGRRGEVGDADDRPDATEEDDVAVWTWTAPQGPHLQPSWWHVTLPFLDHDRPAVRLDVLWADGVAPGRRSPISTRSPVSAGQIEAKLLTLWPIALGAERDGDTAHGLIGDRARGRDRVPTGSGPAVPSLSAGRRRARSQATAVPPDSHQRAADSTLRSWSLVRRGARRVSRFMSCGRIGTAVLPRVA